jgi:ABC-type amino acid transport substrate-binding protein
MHIYTGSSHTSSAYGSSYIFRKLAGLGLTLLLTRLLALLLISMPVMAEDAVSPSQTDRVLKVGTMHSPPFIIENADGSFDGISIMLWDHIAKRLDLRYEFHTGNIETLLTQLETGEIDVAVAALTITEQREVGLDFTHPFYTTGLSGGTRYRATQHDHRLADPAVLLAISASGWPADIGATVCGLAGLVYRA